MSRKIGILGSGMVAQTLASGLLGLGFEVAIGSRTGKKADSWEGPVGTFLEVAASADLVVLAVKGSAAEEVVAAVKPQLAGKTVIDTTNPLVDQPAEDGVLRYFTSLDSSLMERLQQLAPKANLVKAFNSVGSGVMVHPHYKGTKPTMFICGNSQPAKQEVSEILDSFGWEAADMGGVKSARAIEPLCMLWCIPGFLQNQWSHAFKLLKE